MAQFPSLPLWTDAYLADTMQLDCMESGAYLHLLIAAWRSPDCTLPKDDKRLSRMAKCTPRQWSKIKAVVLAFWTETETGLVQKRLLDEHNFVTANSKQQAHKAKSRWLKTKETVDATASPGHMPDECRTDAPTPTPTPIEDTIVSSPPVSPPKEKPPKVEPKDWLPSQVAYERGRCEGYTVEEVDYIAEGFRDYAIDNPKKYKSLDRAFANWLTSDISRRNIRERRRGLEAGFNGPRNGGSSPPGSAGNVLRAAQKILANCGNS